MMAMQATGSTTIRVLERQIDTALERIADIAEALADLYMLYSVWLEQPHSARTCRRMNREVNRLAREILAGRTQQIDVRFHRAQEVKR